MENSSLDKSADIRLALASLQLPHMPSDDLSGAGNHSASSPTIRVLVVADVDLRSAAALAEYTLQQKDQVFDKGLIDLCIACGPFCRDEDLLPYMRGKQRRLCFRTDDSETKPTSLSATPFFRTRETTAALEGIMTAALSQLESIVCRVIYCPGSSDPVSTLTGNDSPRRLTPNSRNVHKQWLPLAPGIGCAALFYLDSPEAIRQHHNKGQLKEHDTNRAGDDSDENDEEETWDIFTEQLAAIRQSAEGYCSTLERLLILAPDQSHSVPFRHAKGQTILVTHYVDSHALLGIPARQTDEDIMASLPPNGSPLWALEENGVIPSPSAAPSMPWPRDHDKLLESAIAQQLLCLEIASGSASEHQPQWIQKGPTPVLLPGSLRERGEFSILELSLILHEPSEVGTHITGKGKDYVENDSMSSTRRPTPRPSFVWKVRNADFYRLNRYP